MFNQRTVWALESKTWHIMLREIDYRTKKAETLCEKTIRYTDVMSTKTDDTPEGMVCIFCLKKR